MRPVINLSTICQLFWRTNYFTQSKRCEVRNRYIRFGNLKKNHQRYTSQIMSFKNEVKSLFCSQTGKIYGLHKNFCMKTQKIYHFLPFIIYSSSIDAICYRSLCLPFVLSNKLFFPKEMFFSVISKFLYLHNAPTSPTICVRCYHSLFGKKICVMCSC